MKMFDQRVCRSTGGIKIMARVMRCDRCGKIYEGIEEFKNWEKANGVIFVDNDWNGKYWTRKSYDLCVDCMRKLEAFIRKEE